LKKLGKNLRKIDDLNDGLGKHEKLFKIHSFDSTEELDM
jgi:hypothetical protein